MPMLIRLKQHHIQALQYLLAFCRLLVTLIETGTLSIAFKDDIQGRCTFEYLLLH